MAEDWIESSMTVSNAYEIGGDGHFIESGAMTMRTSIHRGY